MRKLIAWNLMTLDGYFEGPTPWSLDFHSTVWGDELERFSLDQGQEIGTLLFGRRTYQGMAAHWTTATDELPEIATMMNGLDKAVASRTLDSADWVNTRLIKTDVAAAVREMKQQPGKDIFVFGSADLLDTLLAANLVDEYRLCLAPVTLGAGTPLFKRSDARHNFKLLETRPLKTGGVLLFYAVGEV